MNDNQQTPDAQQASGGNGMTTWRVVSVLLLLAAIAYVVWTGDYDSRGIIGRVDDFFVFMAAFTLLHGSFQPAHRRYIRSQLRKLSCAFAVLAVCWLIMLAFTAPTPT